MLVIDEGLQIPLSELDFQFVRSSGPGGQNVNKVATKTVLRWDVTGSTSLPEAVRQRFLDRHANRINNAGELILSSDRYRSQGRNIEDCLDRLRELIAEIVKPPPIRKKRRKSRGADRRRLEDKRRIAEKKKGRKPVDGE